MEGEFLSVLAKAFLRRAPAHRPIALTPAAHHVKVFQREPCGVNLCMAGRARSLRAVLLELLADRHCSARIGLDCGHTRWWRRWWLAKNSFHDPRPAQHRGGGSAICRHLQDARLSHEPTTRIVFWQ